MMSTNASAVSSRQRRQDLLELMDRLNPRIAAQGAKENDSSCDRPALVIDISMPILDGLQAVSQLGRENRRTKFVFLTVHEDRDFVDAAFAAGAPGYVTKSRLAADLVSAIREVMLGHTYVMKQYRRADD